MTHLGFQPPTNPVRYGRYMVFGFPRYEGNGGIRDVMWHGDDLDEAQAVLGMALGTREITVYLFDRVLGQLILVDPVTAKYCETDHIFSTQKEGESDKAFRQRCRKAACQNNVSIAIKFRNGGDEILHPDGTTTF